VFADRVMRRQECAEPDTRHQGFLAHAVYANFALPREAGSRRTSRPKAASSDPFSRRPPIGIFRSNRHRRQ
jgi:hypothetical protein